MDYNINILQFIIIILIVYSSSFIGYYIYLLSKDEVKNNIILLKIFSKLIFLIINFLFFYYAFKETNVLFLILFFLSITLLVLKAKIEHNLYFSYLAIIFSISYFYNVNFYYITILLFIYNLTITSVESIKKKNTLKKIMIKKTSFIIISLITILWYLII